MQWLFSTPFGNRLQALLCDIETTCFSSMQYLHLSSNFVICIRLHSSSDNCARMHLDRKKLDMSESLKTDYLVVGSGVVGMAFIDTLLTETDANIIVVDRHAKPGGHWNDAYSFVTLHQPSSFFGVSSKELSRGVKDHNGLNKGMNDLATGPELSAYFDEVMRLRFLASGRVQYFPMCDYSKDGKFTSKVTGKSYQVDYKKLVDATFMTISVPSTHKPNFSVALETKFMPPNSLPNIHEKPDGYVVIGGGKTAVDACIWLLEKGVDPDDITWIISRDAWMLDRANAQPTEEFFMQAVGAQAAQVEAIAGADSIEDMFDRLEAGGCLLRLDENIRPSMFHAATISRLELAELRRIKNVVRLGHVTSIEANQITLSQGTIATSPKHIHIDCSASLERSFAGKEPGPVFTQGVITLQPIRAYQPAFSASMTAYVETHYTDEAEQNKLCTPVPLPNKHTDFIDMTLAMMINQFNWSQDRTLRKWVKENRLDGFSKVISGIDPEDNEKMDIIQRLRDNAFPAVENLQKFATQLADGR